MFVQPLYSVKGCYEVDFSMTWSTYISSVSPGVHLCIYVNKQDLSCNHFLGPRISAISSFSNNYDYNLYVRYDQLQKHNTFTVLCMYVQLYLTEHFRQTHHFSAIQVSDHIVVRKQKEFHFSWHHQGIVHISNKLPLSVALGNIPSLVSVHERACKQ